MRILCSCSTSVRSELKKIAGVCTNPTLVPLWLIVILLPAALKDSAVAENLGKGGAPVRPDEFLKGRERRRDAGQRSTAGPCSSPTRAHFGGQNRPRGPGDVSFFRVPPPPPHLPRRRPAERSRARSSLCGTERPRHAARTSTVSRVPLLAPPRLTAPGTRVSLRTLPLAAGTHRGPALSALPGWAGGHYRGHRLSPVAGEAGP